MGQRAIERVFHSRRGVSSWRGGKTKGGKGAIEQLNQELDTPQTFYRQDKQGKIFELNLVTVKNEEYRKVAEIIAGQWQKLG